VADVEALLAGLTLDEKAALTAGADFWSTVAVPRLGIPSVGLTDGPSGARGQWFPGAGGLRSVCVPCGSAMGATWNPALAREIGALVAREALDRGCPILLAPTVNLHRALLAGRNFECYAEDPLLSGRLAAGFVAGAHSEGVISTVKHLVGNEAEHERGSISSVIDERALRELYLVPFELAIREGGALAVMTSYNRLNGRWLTEQPEVLRDLLRGEWGFEGLVMTDWFAVADTVVSATAGLDLEMPGPGRAFGSALLDAVQSDAVPEKAVDELLRRLLGALDRAGILDRPALQRALGEDRPEDRALVRRAAAEACVLLRNEGALPLDASELDRVAVIGPAATVPSLMGGGSSQVNPHPAPCPLAALRAALPEVEVFHERGCESDKALRPVGAPGLPVDDAFEVEVFAGQELRGEPVRRFTLGELRFLTFGPSDPRVPKPPWCARVRGTVTPGESGRHRLTVAQCGRTRVLVDGEVALDALSVPPPPGGTEFFGLASQELEGAVELTAGTPVEVVVELYTHPDEVAAGTRVAFGLPDRADILERAVSAAEQAAAAVVVVGTSDAWETEQRDRTSFQLPGRQDELVRRIAAVNPRTVVVVNAGGIVDLPWADDVAAVLQCWFGGQELGPALADVLTGAADPGGRLATTIPLRLEHAPSHDNFPGENGELRYGEGLFMGYRGYDHRALPVRFPFGHGLSYTSFVLGEPEVASPTFRPGDRLEVRVPVTNTGTRRGTEVVQLYVAPHVPRLARPPQELKAFAKVALEPGETASTTLVLDDRSFAYWDPGQADWPAIQPRLAGMLGVEPAPPAERRPQGWQVDPGRYELRIGRSSRSIDHIVTMEVQHP
jgi:beta-glucosidase